MTTAPHDEIPCIEIVELVTAYLEGALPAVDRDRFEAHLLGCPDCREYVDQMRETIARTGSLTEEDVPPDTMARLRAAFRDWGASSS